MSKVLDGLKLVIDENYTNRKKIWKLAVNEIKIMSVGTSLGYFWTMTKDIIYFIVYTAFLLIMYNNITLDGLPRMVFLVTGLIPWYFISDCLGGGANSIRKRGGILTKMKFPMTIIPTYDVIGIFLKRIASYLIIIVMMTLYCTDGSMHIFDIPADTHRYILEIQPLRVIYYTFAMVVFMTVFSMLISGFVAISKDFNEFYSSIVRVMFFFVPIMWFPQQISDKSQIAGFIAKLNPLVYLIEGNRAAFTGIEGNSLEYTIYFWCLTILLFILACYVQGKLRRIYADFL